MGLELLFAERASTRSFRKRGHNGVKLISEGKLELFPDSMYKVKFSGIEREIANLLVALGLGKGFMWSNGDSFHFDG